MSGNGAGMIVHAGVVLPRLLADRVELTPALAEAVARKGFTPAHDRGRVLVDAACALAAGGKGLTDAEAIAAQLWDARRFPDSIIGDTPFPGPIVGLLLGGFW